MDSLSAEVATLQTMLSSAQEMKVDGEGRIMLSADFIAFAELGDMALYAGIGRSFQIWLPERYRARETEARGRARPRACQACALAPAAGRPTSPPAPGEALMTAAHPQHQALHTPVLLREVVTALAPFDGGTYLDATFGNGGYSEAILTAAACSVIAIDRDPDAIARGARLAETHGARLQLREGCFSQMRDLAGPATSFDGIAFDLGVCSTQLDQAERGFSFRLDGPLDMRMSKSGDSAADIVMRLDEKALAAILWDYGEERASRRIARAIVRARDEEPITTTGGLAAIIHGVMPAPRQGQPDSATRSFQALRIYVNRELGEIEDGLAAAEAMLKPGGILAVVSFHSLEDRIVKRFLGARSGARARPSRHLPDIEAPEPTFELLARKPILPGAEETGANARARSAKLRVARRTGPHWRPRRHPAASMAEGAA